MATQMLQPMHSRMAPILPWRILSGRKGSAMDGLAAPIRSSTPAHRGHHGVPARVAANAHHGF